MSVAAVESDQVKPQVEGVKEALEVAGLKTVRMDIFGGWFEGVIVKDLDVGEYSDYQLQYKALGSLEKKSTGRYSVKFTYRINSVSPEVRKVILMYLAARVYEESRKHEVFDLETSFGYQVNTNEMVRSFFAALARQAVENIERVKYGEEDDLPIP